MTLDELLDEIQPQVKEMGGYQVKVEAPGEDGDELLDIRTASWDHVERTVTIELE